MKTSSMYRLSCMVLLLITGFTACKKEAEPNPELSARVVGTYTLTRIKTNGKLYTINAQTNGKMSVIRESATAVSVNIDVTTGSPTDNIHFSATNVSLRDAGNGEVDLVKDNNSFARGGNNTLTVSVSPLDGSDPYDLIGTK